jgi:hypothetical protein
MNRLQSIRATLLSLAEFVVITVATLGLPFASGSVQDRTVRLLRGMNQRAVFEAGTSDIVSIDGSSEALIFEPASGSSLEFSGDALDTVGSLPSPFGASHWGAPKTIPFPIALDASRAATATPLRARAPPIG